MAGQQEVVKTTRRKSSFFDRIKIAVFLGVIIFVVVGSQANPPFDPFWRVFGEFVSEPGGMVLVGLFLLEVLRQVHYYISEKSASYNSFWQQNVWGGLDRTAGKMNPWTRFRVGRYIKWLFIIIPLYAITVDYFVDDVNSPIEAITQTPRLLAGALPYLLQVFVIMFIAIGQFVAIFWFLSRGGMDTIMPEEIKTRFNDVWGQDHVLDLIRENIAFLERPDEIEAKGGYIPGGILLWGPPGTGKTLMAEAIAGETGRPFVFVEPGAFIQMFMGVGILKVKSLYRKLRKLSLRHGGVIVFFDEADALGSRGTMGQPTGVFGADTKLDAFMSCNGFEYLSPIARNSLVDAWGLTAPATVEVPKKRFFDRIIMGGMGGGGMGTLQALLTEMNGLTKPRGMGNKVRKALGFRPKPPPKYRILHIMATNMPNALDEAMLRPGRIDRMYKVGFPSKEGRKQTLVGYLDKVKHGLAEEEVEKLSVVTPYYSGAKIKDLVNEALIIAIRDGRDTIGWDDIWRAKALKELGPPEDVDYIQRERHAVAIHEASHAVAAHLLGDHRRIDMVTIEKRSTTLGMVRSLGSEERFTQWKTEFETDIMVSLASRAGERMFFSEDNSSGVSGDLTNATTVAALMEGAWGMGRGLVSFSGTKSNQAGGTDNPVSVALRARGPQVEELLDQLYAQVSALLEEHHDQVLAVAAALEEHKTISGDDVAEIMGTKPGERSMREPKGWRQVSEKVAEDRKAEAAEALSRKVSSNGDTSNGHHEDEADEADPEGEATAVPAGT
ncbi:MAG TPA: AAA family ATPase [Acidimicrobiia bacterium]|jgi:ATP-dependent Zn protease